MRRIKASLMLAALTGCGDATSSSFQRYMDGEREYIAVLKKGPPDLKLSEQIDRATGVIRSMPDERIDRLHVLGYPLLKAAEEELRNRSMWSTTGSDWTRYAAPASCCQTPEEADKLRQARTTATCRNTQFRTVQGSIARVGRQTQPVPLSVVGIVPFGVDEYRGTLTTQAGSTFPVVWERDWYGDYGDPRADDPMDDRVQSYGVRRLAGARYWIIISRSGLPLEVPYIERIACPAAAGKARA